MLLLCCFNLVCNNIKFECLLVCIDPVPGSGGGDPDRAAPHPCGV